MAQEVIDSLAVRELDVSANVVANATANLSITNIAPAAVTTATIAKWLKVVDQGVEYYIPMWT